MDVDQEEELPTPSTSSSTSMMTDEKEAPVTDDPAVLEQVKRITFENTIYELKIRYVPEKTIGQGAFGSVIAVRDSVTGERRAIKKQINIFDHPYRAKQTLREIVISRQLDHECFLEIHDVFLSKDGSDLYIVMDLMDYDLHKVIYCSRSPQTLDQITFFVYEILRGVGYMHTRGIMHRDLKPGNIFVDRNCDTKIGDLGMARVIDTRRSSGDSSGIFMTEYVSTRWYRSPEILMWNAYGFEVDTWAAGTILAELLMGRPLFPGDSTQAMIKLFISLLGTPPPEFQARLNPRSKVALWLKAQPVSKPKNLREVFPPTCPIEALDLLKKLLVYDPYQRLGVISAMRHPLFRRYHNEVFITELRSDRHNPESSGSTVSSHPKIDYPHLIDEGGKGVTTETLKRAIMQEVDRYQRRPAALIRRTSSTDHPGSSLDASMIQ